MAQVIQTSQENYLLSDPENGNLSSERDILDLFGLFGDVGANLLLVSDGALHRDFFDLSTGLAGVISLKHSTYRVKTAIVIDMESIQSQRFREWAGECNRGREIRFCANLQDAEEWLLDLV